MFLHPLFVANSNRYVENGPEDRNPSFKHGFAGRSEVSGGILRYSTTSKAPVSGPPIKRAAALAALKSIAKAGN
ncbi:hypothetical protein JHN55_22930 [Streptomyces sp. MBT56]|uniref:hypothetical protein n=1 Tax=unclassified Streptomyces TaxID=2593676 RepID=UPI00190AB886|nr:MULTISPECIES: hypothetical protein [unclassified Streptomyces]MBK3559325.1 hypothetical protein [Streptomyces sp. MBT56]MBK3601048.1 hypothetical protein [Streptomyces sp. MBT54]MBK3613954.1 hypothetical protein [Streptomyces sp. MBT98]MBK6041981.1 hypothetical protein [Streptomyces sp. MBT55]